jgi:hypothetical protein
VLLKVQVEAPAIINGMVCRGDGGGVGLGVAGTAVNIVVLRSCAKSFVIVELQDKNVILSFAHSDIASINDHVVHRSRYWMNHEYFGIQVPFS